MSAGWRDGCPVAAVASAKVAAAGMTAKRISSGRWFGSLDSLDDQSMVTE